MSHDSQDSRPDGPNSAIFDGLAGAIRDSKKKYGDPFAAIRYYLRAHYGVDALDLTGEDDPFLFDLFQVEFGLTPAELGKLTPTQSGGLLTLSHRLKTGVTDSERSRVLLDIKTLRDQLSGQSDISEVGRIILKALSAFPEPTPITAVGVGSIRSREPWEIALAELRSRFAVHVDADLYLLRITAHITDQEAWVSTISTGKRSREIGPWRLPSREQWGGDKPIFHQWLGRRGALSSEGQSENDYGIRIVAYGNDGELWNRFADVARLAGDLIKYIYKPGWRESDPSWTWFAYLTDFPRWDVPGCPPIARVVPYSMLDLLPIPACVALETNVFQASAWAIDVTLAASDRGGKDGPRIIAPSRPRPAVGLSIKGNEATVDGYIYVLKNPQAAFVQELVDKGPGVWVASPKMGVRVQPRPDRVFAKLPKPIWSKIESKTGAGYRIKVE